MDVLSVILGVICLLVGLAGCSLPILSGPPVTYLALWLLHFTGYTELTATELIVWELLVVLVQAMGYVAPVLGTRYSGGSKWGNWGCVVETVAGMFVLPPWEILLDPFVGELLGDKVSGDALKTGFEAFVGSLLSVVLKATLCGYFIYSFVRRIIN